MAIHAAAGAVLEHGEFIPGEPHVVFTDPDGYKVEIWYELPTPLDPRGPRSLAATARKSRGRG